MIAWNVLELKKSETPPSGLSLSEVAARGRLMGIRIVVRAAVCEVL